MVLIKTLDKKAQWESGSCWSPSSPAQINKGTFLFYIVIEMTLAAVQGGPEFDKHLALQLPLRGVPETKQQNKLGRSESTECRRFTFIKSCRWC
jgi:hypothetical protein